MRNFPVFFSSADIKVCGKIYEQGIKLTFRGIMDKIKWIIAGKIGPIMDKWGQLYELYIHRKVCGQHVIHRVDK